MKTIQNKILNIYGLPGSGKTFFACFLASLYKRIYSNFDVTYKGAIVSNRLGNMKEIEMVKFSETKGVCIIDEGGLNINSRRSMSDGNLEFAELLMLGRKKNVDIIFIAQLDYSLDKYARDLSPYKFRMQQKFENGRMVFEAFIMDLHGKIIGSKDFDLILWSELSGYSYNSLEDSIIEKSRKEDSKIFDIFTHNKAGSEEIVGQLLTG